jgi:hypothetical protein
LKFLHAVLPCLIVYYPEELIPVQYSITKTTDIYLILIIT